jgi:hypothetical protein
MWNREQPFGNPFANLLGRTARRPFLEFLRLFLRLQGQGQHDHPGGQQQSQRCTVSIHHEFFVPLCFAGDGIVC